MRNVVLESGKALDTLWHDREGSGVNNEESATSRRLVGSFVISATLLPSDEAALVLLVQLYLKDLGASPPVISLSGSLAWVGTLIASPFWGITENRALARKLIFVILLGSSRATSLLVLLLGAPLVLALGTARRFLANGLPPIGMKMISSGR